MALILHGYWRSGTSHRVRIGLNLKGVVYETRPVNLLKGEHTGAAYRALNPQGLAPSLEVDGRVLTQSSAILEWLEETYPDPPLLPADPFDRAAVRAIAAVVGADVHPLHNMRVGREVQALGGDPKAWNARWITAGLDALEPLLAALPPPEAPGWRPGLAECYLVPLGYAADRFEVDLQPYPRLAARLAQAQAYPAIAAAHPDRQPDAPPAS
jgi:maleylpyruvate isomerase